MFGKSQPDSSSESVPAIKYVNLMILDAIKNGRDQIVVRSSDTLPTLGEMMKDSHPEGFRHASRPPPPFKVISNRLKVMSMLTPMQHKTPVNGTIELRADDEEFYMDTLFDDTDDDPFCSITISKTLPNN